MAIKINIQKNPVCFPSKILGGNGGAHILNMVMSADTPNGTVVGVGDYSSFDKYAVAAAPAAFRAKVLEQAADGNWLVQVTAISPNEPAVLICDVPEITEDYNAKFSKAENFYNAAGSVARGYVLSVLDVYELSADAFTGTPAAGKTLTISGQKHVVAQ